MSSAAKALVEQYWDSWNTGDVATLDVLFSPTIASQFKDYVTWIRTVIPDCAVTVEDLIAEGDKVVTRYTVRGTHQGPWELRDLGTIPPTGKQVRLAGINIFRITNGKITEEWDSSDLLDALRQLGVVAVGVQPG